MITGSAVITGVAKGIGRAIAIRFLAEGLSVVGVDQDAVALQNLVSGLGTEQFVPFEGDVAHSAVLAEAGEQANEIAPLKTWVNNAGYNVVGFAHDIDHSVAQRGIDVLLSGTFSGTQIALQSMMKSGGGSIINISSVQAVRSFPSMAIYAMCKGGIGSLTRQIAVDYAHFGIRANVIAPGAVETSIDSTDYSDSEVRQSVIDALSPIPRVGQPEDIAESAVFLADDEKSGYITGQILYVDGGLSVANPGWDPNNKPHLNAQ